MHYKPMPIHTPGEPHNPLLIPFEAFDGHEPQCAANHGGRSLAQMREQGGLTAGQAIAILEDRPFVDSDEGPGMPELRELLRSRGFT